MPRSVFGRAVFESASITANASLGLSLKLDGWLSALIVAAALFVVAGVAALVGKKEVTQATPPVPTQAVQSVSDDVHAIKPGSAS